MTIGNVAPLLISAQRPSTFHVGSYLTLSLLSLDQTEEPGGLLLDQRLGGERHLLKLLGVGGGHLGAGDTLGGSVKVVKGVLHGQGEDLGADAEGRVAGLDDQQAVRLLDGVDNCLEVDGLDGAQVEDLGLDAVLLLEVLGGDEGLAHAARDGDDGQVLAGALDLGLAEGNDEVVFLGGLAHGEGLAVQQLVLEEDGGVGVADGGLEQALGVLGAPGGDDLEAGNAAVPRAVVLGVLGRHAGGEAVGSTEGDVAGLDAAGHVQGLGGRVDDLVDGLHGKVEGHELALDRSSAPC